MVHDFVRSPQDRTGPIYSPDSLLLDFAIVDDGGRNVQIDGTPEHEYDFKASVCDLPW